MGISQESAVTTIPTELGVLYAIADITVTTKDSVLLDTLGLSDGFVATVDVILKEVHRFD